MSRLHLRQSAELLGNILADNKPADSQMDAYFRAHREMGVRDRGQVAECVYACLRQKRQLEHLCETNDPWWLVAAERLRAGISARGLEEAGFRHDARALAARVRAFDPDSAPLPIRTDLPDWLAEKLVAQFGEAETRQLADALNRPAPVDLRTNTLKTDRDSLARQLAAEGFNTSATPWSPVGLRRSMRESLFNTSAFRDGLFEIQDEGSQLLSLIVEPKRHEMVVDFCAGAGGKTLHLGALMANTGTVYAFDISAKRLERLKPRLRRSGLQNVRTVHIAHERDDRVRRLEGKADRVLVDAPCSGTGTLRRNPDIKWRPIDLPALVADQYRILDAAATLVRPGGRLVYATCSLLKEENDDVVAGFVSRHAAFTTVRVAEVLLRRHVNLPEIGDRLQLLPHRHGTDGFFAAMLERQK